MGLILGDYSVIRHERLRTQSTISIAPKHHVEFIDADLWSEADPPLLIGPDAQVGIHFCRLAGTWVEWYQAHEVELRTGSGNNYLVPMSPPGEYGIDLSKVDMGSMTIEGNTISEPKKGVRKMTMKGAAIHYAQVVDELMNRRLDWLQENEPEWLEHMAVARLRLLTHTGNPEIRKEAKRTLAGMAG